MKPFNRILKDFTDQFDIKNISLFITEQMPDDVTPFFKRNRIKELLEQYNYLSSNIHGGPSSDIFYFEDARLAYRYQSQVLLQLFSKYQS